MQSNPLRQIYLDSQGVSGATFGVARYSLDLWRGLREFGVDAQLNPLTSARDGWFLEEISPAYTIPRWLNTLSSRINWLGDAFYAKSRKPQILHRTYYSRNFQSPTNQTRVMTLYDMIHERFPENFNTFDRANRFKLNNLQNADRIICISEATRNDLEDIYPGLADKADVVHLGLNPKFFDEFKYPPTRDEKTLLFVGSRRSYKNFPALVEAFSKLLSEFDPELKLTIFGGEPMGEDDFLLFDSNAIPTTSVIEKRGSVEDLIAEYRSATVLVYPSLFEGFGYPPLEAMSQGCQVIASDIAPFRETLGGFATLVDANSVDELSHAIRAALEKQVSDPLESRDAVRHVQEFTVERMVLETVEIYKKALAT